jgi:hypothetical protein
VVRPLLTTLAIGRAELKHGTKRHNSLFASAQ